MNPTGQRGFTLLELLVAVALTSIVIIGLMAAFRNMVTVYAYIRESRENSVQMRALMGLLGDDLLSVSKEFAFIGTPGVDDGRGVRLLEFVGGVTVERQEAEPTLTRVLVVYSLTRDDGEMWTLMRGERPHPAIDGGWKNSPIPVLRHVETLQFFYEWPSGAVQNVCSLPPGGALPAFVRLEAVLRQGDKTIGHSVRFPVAPRL